MSKITDQVVELSDGVRTSIEIAELVGASPRYVRRIQQQKGLPRLNVGAHLGERNHQYVAGRRVDLDGYVIVTAPKDHPYARYPRGRHRVGVMFEHRLVMEKKLGRYLSPSEVVDHIDGLTLHNAPENLRLFANNAEHLSVTRAGRAPHISAEGHANHNHKFAPPVPDYLRVDNHALRRKAGALRLRQILLTALQLGTDSPYLLGTHRHTTKAGIDLSSRSTIERALAGLCQQWGWPHTQ